MVFPLRIFIHTLMVLVLIASAPGCASFQKVHLLPRRKSKVAAVQAEAPRRIGTITLVNENDRFVLIDTGMSGAPALGTALKSFTGETASGVVAVGNVNRRPFVVADIVQGSPKKGDGVFQ